MTAQALSRIVATPQGDGRLLSYPAAAPVAALLLGHGAGGGPETHDLIALAHALPGQGVTVHLFEQPWHVAGRPVASPPAALDEAFAAAVAVVRDGLDVPLVVGGRSAGARSAVRMAGALGAAGALALAFPLHAPGKPDGPSRLGELAGAGVPTLVIQGERDAFGRPEEFPDDIAEGVEMTVVPFADHALSVPKSAGLTQDEADALVVESALEWLFSVVVGTQE